VLVQLLLPCVALRAEIPDEPKPSASVYLNDSFEAADAVEAARRLAERGQWFEAAERLRDAVRRYHDKLIDVGQTHYISAPLHITNVVASWPAEGIAAYRSIASAEVDEALSRLGDSVSLPELLPILDRYFCTAQAVNVIDRVGDLAIEAGDFSLARRVFSRALALHPDRVANGDRWNHRLQIVKALAGEPATGAAPAGHIRWMGQSSTVASVIKQIRSSYSLENRALAADYWPIFGGTESRIRRGSTRVSELGLLWRVDTLGGLHQGSFATRYADDEIIDTYSRVSIEPVVANGLVLVQRLREVTAVNINTGAEVWRFRADGNQAPGVDEIDDFPPGWHAVTVSGDRVYVAMPGDTAPYYGYESSRSIAELVCLDLSTGKAIWRSSRLTLGEDFSELYFDSSPIIDHGRVYVVGRRRRSFGFEDCYLHCFQAADGSPLFRTHIGSASTGTFGSQRATVAIPSLCGDTIYVCTNLGTIAAVSSHTGLVHWLRLYPRLVDAQSKTTGWPANRVRPWEFNSAIAHQGRIISLPIDSSSLLILDEKDGRVIRNVTTDMLSDMRTLLGVSGDIVCGSGQEIVCYDFAKDVVLWSSPIPQGEPVIGRGCWVDDKLLVPTSKALYQIALQDGGLTSIPWPPDGDAGNILALPDRLLVAGSRHLSLYVQKHEIWEAVRSRMEASPDDPNPALDLAEVAFGSGEFDQALEALGEAVARIDAGQSAIEPELRSRIFGDTLTFAEKLTLRNELDVDTAELLLGYASSFALAESDHIRYRLRFADVFQRLAVPNRAVDLWQQILQDTTLRTLTYGDLGIPSRPSGEIAETAIAEMIKSHGREVYGPFDRMAARLLDSALDDVDAARLLRIASAFPNSKSAPTALLSRGEILLDAGEPLDAVKAMILAYHHYGQTIDRAKVMRRIADAYEVSGRREHAYRWLTKAAREFPGALVEYDGRRLSFARYLDRFSDIARQVEPAALQMTLPLNHGFLRDVGDLDLLLTPKFRANSLAVANRYYVRTEDELHAYEARRNVEAWSIPQRLAGTPDLLIDTRNVAVFATATQLYGVSPQGEIIWSHGKHTQQQADDDWEDVERIRVFDITRDRLIAHHAGLLFCIRIGTGETIWETREYPDPGRRVRQNSERVAFDTTRGGDSAIYVLNAKDASLVGIVNTAEAWSVEDLFLTLENRLILVTSRSVAAFDVEKNRPLWHVDLNGQLEPGTVSMDVDGLYLSDDGRRIKMISLETGATIWTSQRLLPRIQQDVSANLVAGNLLVSSTTAAAAVDTVTHLKLWEADTPPDPRFRFRAVTGNYLIAVHIPDAVQDAEGAAYFFDHRHGSGQVAPEGGKINLGKLANVKVVFALDHTLIIQAGSEIYGWTNHSGK
jgi:outer membrane protein assembly factor BamB